MLGCGLRGCGGVGRGEVELHFNLRKAKSLVDVVASNFSLASLA